MDWKQCLSNPNDPNSVATLNCLPILFRNVVNGALLFAGTIAVFIIIISGYKYVKSGGDPKELEGARHSLLYGILGLLIILFSFLILRLIAYTTKTECITTFGFTNCQ